MGLWEGMADSLTRYPERKQCQTVCQDGLSFSESGDRLGSI